MSEAKLQTAVVNYIRYAYPGVRLCASLGGLYTTRLQAIKAKRTGYVKGFPDLFVAVARGGYYGLFIELKVKPNKATPHQKEWIKDLNNAGYYAAITTGIDQTLAEVDSYFDKPLTKSGSWDGTKKNKCKCKCNE